MIPVAHTQVEPVVTKVPSPKLRVIKRPKTHTRTHESRREQSAHDIEEDDDPRVERSIE